MSFKFKGPISQWQSKETLYKVAKNYKVYKGYKVPKDYELFTPFLDSERIAFKEAVNALDTMMIEAYMKLENGSIDVKNIFDDFCFQRMVNHRKTGAADSEPRRIVFAFLEVFILDELQKRKTEKLIESIKAL